jgi:hypothetical protein
MRWPGRCWRVLIPSMALMVSMGLGIQSLGRGETPEGLQKPSELSKLPPFQRLLKGDDAKTAEELTKRIEEREAADDYSGAIAAAEDLQALRQRPSAGCEI